jgi:hypothetical protein
MDFYLTASPIPLPCIESADILIEMQFILLVFQVFVIGNRHYISERPSIKNLQPGGKALHKSDIQKKASNFPRTITHAV